MRKGRIREGLWNWVRVFWPTCRAMTFPDGVKYSCARYRWHHGPHTDNSHREW